MKTHYNYKAWNVSSNNGTLEDVVAYGLLAPSSHNTQPWKYIIDGNYIKILPDYDRSLPYSDRFNREMFITLGCTWANCEIAAKHFGYEVISEVLPEDEIDDVAIRIKCTKPTSPRMKDKNRSNITALFDAITLRQTNRGPHTKQKIEDIVLELCNRQIDRTDMLVHILTDTKRKNVIADIAAEVAAFVYNDPVFKKELQEWLRPISTKEKDGIALFDTGLPAKATERIVKNIVNADPTEEAKRDKGLIKASTALFVLSAQCDTKESWLRAGRAIEYCWLVFASYGIAVAPMTGLVEHPVAHKKLMQLLDVTHKPLFFARIGYVAARTHVSPRRPLEDVLKRSL